MSCITRTQSLTRNPASSARHSHEDRVEQWWFVVADIEHIAIPVEGEKSLACYRLTRVSSQFRVNVACRLQLCRQGRGKCADHLATRGNASNLAHTTSYDMHSRFFLAGGNESISSLLWKYVALEDDGQGSEVGLVVWSRHGVCRGNTTLYERTTNEERNRNDDVE